MEPNAPRQRAGHSWRFYLGSRVLLFVLVSLSIKIASSGVAMLMGRDPGEAWTHLPVRLLVASSMGLVVGAWEYRGGHDWFRWLISGSRR